MKKLLAFLSLICFFILCNTNTTFAYSGNGFVWNTLELTIPINSSLESYLSNFEVRFYYNGKMTNKEVKVELDSFYYGSLSIDTSKVAEKEVTLIATVSGYTNYDRQTVKVHIKDYEAPTIKCIKDLVFNYGDEIDFTKCFSITDNAGIDEKTVSVEYNVNHLSDLGEHEVTVSCSDVNGNLAKKTYTYFIKRKDEIVMNVASHIEIEYNDLNYLEYLKTCVQASDDYDGDISGTVSVSNLDIKKLGNQDIEISVKNSAGVTKTILKTIKVVDLTAPVLELKTYHDTVLKDDVYNVDFYSYINKIYDNASDLTEQNVEIDTSDFTYNIGQNSVYYVLKDESNNYTKRELIIDVRYEVAPIILVDEEKLTFVQGESFNLSDYIHVSSEYDPNVSSNYKLDEKVLNRDEPGVYEIIIEAMDYAGNEAVKKCFVTIESKDEQGIGNTLNGIYKFIYKYKLIFILFIIGIFVWLIIFINKKKKKLGE